MSQNLKLPLILPWLIMTYPRFPSKTAHPLQRAPAAAGIFDQRYSPRFTAGDPAITVTVRLGWISWRYPFCCDGNPCFQLIWTKSIATLLSSRNIMTCDCDGLTCGLMAAGSKNWCRFRCSFCKKVADWDAIPIPDTLWCLTEMVPRMIRPR